MNPTNACLSGQLNHPLTAAQWQHQTRFSNEAAAFLKYAAGDASCISLASFTPFYRNTKSFCYDLQAWPAFLPASLGVELGHMAVTVDRLVKGVFTRVFGGDLEKICNFYQIDRREEAKLVLTEPTGIEAAISRQDCLLTARGPKCIEMNCGSYLSGWEISWVGQALQQCPPIARFLAQEGLRINYPNTLGMVFRHLVQTALQLPGFKGRALNVAITASHYMLKSKPVRAFHAALYNRALKRALAELAPELPGRCIICEPANLKASGAKLYADGQQIHAIFEQHDHSNPSAAFRAAKAGGTALFSGPITLFLSDKRNLALLSEQAVQETSPYTASERQAIQKYIPWTRIAARVHTRFDGETVYLPELLNRQQNRLVLKGAQSLGGWDVVLGKATQAQAWEKAVAKALEDGHWIVQEHLDSPVPYFMSRGGEVVPHHQVLGVFAIGGAFGGGTLRTLPAANAEIVNVKQGANLTLLLFAQETSKSSSISQGQTPKDHRS